MVKNSLKKIVYRLYLFYTSFLLFDNTPMLTLNDILKAKSNPDYYQLTFPKFEATNENWYAQMNESRENAFKLSQIETMVLLKTLSEAFPEVNFFQLQAEWLEDRTTDPNYLNTRFRWKIKNDDFYEFSDLIRIHPIEPQLAKSIEQLFTQLIPMACRDLWRNWKNELFAFADYIDRNTIEKAYLKKMTSESGWVAKIEKLNLEKMLPENPKFSIKRKI